MRKKQQPKRSRKRGGASITLQAEIAFKKELKALDGNKCANPLHDDWKENCESLTYAFPALANKLSVHRIVYGSQNGQYTFENSVTSCERCHDCVQRGFRHKTLGWLKAHVAMLLWLREAKSGDDFRHQKPLEELENKYGHSITV